MHLRPARLLGGLRLRYGLIALTKEEMLREQSNPDSAMWKLAEGNINNVNGRTSFDAMRAGDPAGKSVVDRYIDYLACGLVNAINIFQPDVICLGGGISKEGRPFCAPCGPHRARPLQQVRPEADQNLPGGAGERRRHHRRGAARQAV